MGRPIRLKIGGIAYSVSSSDDEAYIRGLAAELEHKMKRLSKEKPFLSTTMTAVMAALEALDEASKTADENAKLQLEVKRLNEQLACQRLQKDANHRHE